MTVSAGGTLLTAPSARDAAGIALDYLHTNAADFGLDSADVDALRLEHRYTSWEGTTHLVFTQSSGGIDALDNDVRANVARDGRLIDVASRAVHDFAAAPPPTLDAGEALGVATRDVGAGGVPPAASRPAGRARRTRFTNGARAELTLFGERGGTRPAWRVTLDGNSSNAYDVIVDARTGAVLRRTGLTENANAAQVYERYPGAPVGGTPATVDLSQWLDDPAAPTALRGNNAYAFSDVDDSCKTISCTASTPEPGEDVGPSSGTDFVYPLTPLSVTGGNCPVAGCTWDHTQADSWTTNRAQATVQLFYYVNRFHDHLKQPPIGFDAASGNFEFTDGDGVLAQSEDGAAGSGGLPDANHVNNASMTVDADGTSPLMQVFLFRPTAASAFGAVDGANDAALVYHEYTHGLSTRLVGSLTVVQPRTMGEGWSDWYAFDFLADEGQVTDTDAPGELFLGAYTDGGSHLARTQPIDCPVGATAAEGCPGTPGAGAGGYTLGDFGKVFSHPEVHADGEIWGETLWDLRRALGSDLTERLVTDAMRLSGPDPSFVAMRDSILDADAAAFNSTHQTTIWQVFAHRGMGTGAATASSSSTNVVESFTTPTSLSPDVVTGDAVNVTPIRATLTGTVDSNAVPTKYRFDYGTTTAYGSRTLTADAGSGDDPVQRIATLTNLTPGTTYHYRLVAIRGTRITAGGDRTFTTPVDAVGPATAPGPTPGEAPGPLIAPLTGSAGAGLQLARSPKSVTATSRRRFVWTVFASPGQVGTVRFRSGRRTLGRASFGVPSSGRARVKVTLSKSAFKLLVRRGRLRVDATVTAAAESATARFTLRAPRRR